MHPRLKTGGFLAHFCKACILADQKAKRELRRESEPGKWRWKRDLVCHDYFAAIDAPIKAYVLGVLAADGNVLPTHHRITLELSAKDHPLLSLIRDELVPGGAITERMRRGYGYQTLVSDAGVRVASRRMIADLEVLGVTAAKSATLQWPATLPVCYAREFILGFFDGDGFITHHQRGSTLYPYVGITSGSPQLLAAIADVIEQETGCRPGGPWRKSLTNAYLIRAAGDHARAVDRWLHRDDLGLKRKRFENALDQRSPDAVE